MISVHRADAVCIMLLTVFTVMCLHIPAIKNRKNRLDTGSRHAFAGLMLLYYSLITAPLLLGPLRFASDAPAVLKPVPFSTIVPMVRDCVQNGIIDTGRLENIRGLSDIALLFRHSARNLAANIILFVPYGVLLALHRPSLPLWKGALFALLLPLGAELWQLLFTSGRTCDIDDVILNYIGIYAGFASTMRILEAKAERALKKKRAGNNKTEQSR